MKFGRDEILMVPDKRCFVLGQVRQYPGRAKIDHGAPLLQITLDCKATATNGMHTNDLEACWKKYCYFWFHSEIRFLHVFDVLLDAFFAISEDFCTVKCFISIYIV